MALLKLLESNNLILEREPRRHLKADLSVAKYRVFGQIFEQIKKFVKNPISIGINSNFIHNIRTCICIKKCNKNGEFSPCHF